MNDKKENAKYITISQASEFSGLHQNTLRRLGDEQTIQCYKTVIKLILN